MGIPWLQGVALLLPGLVAVHLFASGGKNLLEFALAVLLVAAAGAVVARRPRWARLAWMRRGSWWRRGNSARQLKISDPDALVLAGDRLLRQAVADRRPLSLAVLELHDLPEVHRLFGRKLAQQVLARTARSLSAVAGPKGLAVRTSTTQFTLVVPGVKEDAVLLSLRTVFGEACCIEDDGDRDELVLLPRFRVATLGENARSIAPAHAMLCEQLLSSLHRSHEPRHAPSMAAESEPSQPVSLGPPQCELEDGAPPPAYVPTLPLPVR